MNKLNLVLAIVALVAALVGWGLPRGANLQNLNSDLTQLQQAIEGLFAGVTNYDSLELQPASAADNALRVRNFSGTNIVLVDGRGSSTISGVFRASNPTYTALVNSTSVVRGDQGVTSSIVTLTAVQTCNRTITNIGIETVTGTVNMAAANTLTAHCFSRLHDVHSFWLRNASSAGNWNLGNGASSTLQLPLLSGTTSTIRSFATTSIVAQDMVLMTGKRIASGVAPWILWSYEIYGN